MVKNVPRSSKCFQKKMKHIFLSWVWSWMKPKTIYVSLWDSLVLGLAAKVVHFAMFCCRNSLQITSIHRNFYECNSISFHFISLDIWIQFNWIELALRWASIAYWTKQSAYTLYIPLICGNRNRMAEKRETVNCLRFLSSLVSLLLLDLIYFTTQWKLDTNSFFSTILCDRIGVRVLVCVCVRDFNLSIRDLIESVLNWSKTSNIQQQFNAMATITYWIEQYFG